MTQKAPNGWTSVSEIVVDPKADMNQLLREIEVGAADLAGIKIRRSTLAPS